MRRVVLFKGNREMVIGLLECLYMSDMGLHARLINCDRGEPTQEFHLEFVHQLRPAESLANVVLYEELPAVLLDKDAKIAELTKILESFPGHISEDTWNRWIFEKNQVLGRKLPAE